MSLWIRRRGQAGGWNYYAVDMPIVVVVLVVALAVAVLLAGIAAGPIPYEFVGISIAVIGLTLITIAKCMARGRAMQVTGSFPRLLLDIAALAVGLVLIRTFPDLSLKSALLVFKFVPSLCSCVLFTYLCKDHRKALLFTVGGTVLGWLLSPTVSINYECSNWYDDYFFTYQFGPVYSGIGAFVAGATVYALEFIGSGRTKE